MLTNLYSLFVTIPVSNMVSYQVFTYDLITPDELNVLISLEQQSIQWANAHHLKKYALGGRYEPPWPDFEIVDVVPANGVHIVADLNNPWPFEENSVGVFKAWHVIEHLANPIIAMSRIWHCLAPDGWLLIQLPHAQHQDGFQDPTHKSFWVPNSFWYYTWNADYMRPFGFDGLFDMVRISQFYISEYHKGTDEYWIYAILRAKK